jgi:hypothetical protein
MRAALLPTPGDPFMLAYWLRNFETWAEHVDKLVVLVNGFNPADHDELRRIIVEHGTAVDVKAHFSERRMGHDGALRWLLENTEADHVVLCEDDAYVRKPKAVDDAFRMLTSGQRDIVGSPRHEDYASSPLQEWPRHLTQDHEEVRRGLWPAFLFARRRDLLDTDRQYGDRRWNLGQTIEGLGMEVTRELCEFVGIAPDYIHLDTLFGTTFQLRAKSPRIELVHRVRLFDAKAAEDWIADDPPWFHVTGLSTLDYILNERTDVPDHGLWERRIAWWDLAGVFDTPERSDLLERFFVRARIDHYEVYQWKLRFDRWASEAVPA